MERIQETVQLPEFQGKQRIALERFFNKVILRINFIVDRIIEVDTETGLEIIKPGNNAGDDGNWFVTVDSTGDLLFRHKESGSWVRRGPKFKGS